MKDAIGQLKAVATYTLENTSKDVYYYIALPRPIKAAMAVISNGLIP